MRFREADKKAMPYDTQVDLRRTIAGLRRELGARRAERDEALACEAAMAEILQVINSSPGDLAPVFQTIVERAHTLCDDLGEVVEIRVRDNGTGIRPELRDKLFQPFFTTKPTGEGTGLGLSISYDIVTQQHGGTIEVDSMFGEFSEFTIRLPRSRRAAAAGMTA